MPPLVLIHGFASDVATDWPASRWGREAVAVSLPGHRGGPPVTDTMTTSRLVAWLAASIGSGPFDVIGYSLGARLAWDLAAVAPVRRLVLGGLSATEPFGGVDLDAVRSAIRGGPPPADPMSAVVAAMIAGQDAESLLHVVEGLAREPFDPSARAPGVPTLFVAGQDDPMAYGIEDVVARVPGARLVRVPGDHAGALASDEFRTAALDFLQKRRTRELKIRRR
ncbi:alpha/beta fold hydrolase [Fodinicola acaciae]|uniref:alpha/beta fold hydrolase n=1 Tax=Fodinicola acaciae TaxID=2681555 RepID=UPI001C9E5161|nr:alpha/beta hydrolase [Fodinicola acaciae]